MISGNEKYATVQTLDLVRRALTQSNEGTEHHHLILEIGVRITSMIDLQRKHRESMKAVKDRLDKCEIENKVLMKLIKFFASRDE